MTDSFWQAGIQHEVAYWDNWLKTGGGRWPEDYQRRIDPELELQPHFRKLLEGADQPPKILDVGAGPMTVLGKKLGGQNLDITATDALADQYRQILDANGVTPLVQTQSVRAEEISSCWKSAFDLVVARNSLDHCESPAKAFAELVSATKPGGYVWVQVHRNEAIAEHYQGFHQWNMDAFQDNVIVWRKDECYFIQQFVDRSVQLDFKIAHEGQKEAITIIAKC